MCPGILKLKGRQAMGILGVVAFFTLLVSSIDISEQFNTDSDYLQNFLQAVGVQQGRYNFSAPMCSWQGVTCDAQQTHVLKLKIAGAGLSGSVPENSIGKLTSLEALDLDNNFITELPSDMWGLPNLTYLNLSNNNLSGPLPNNIGNFGALTRLDLSVNKLSGSIPQALGSLTNLRFLNLSHNLFTGNLPREIFSYKSLVSLDLSSNKLSSSLPQGLGRVLPGLRRLSLADNQLQGQVDDLFLFSSISYLNLSANVFSGSLSALTNKSSLEIVDLSRNALSGPINPYLFASPRLSVLRLNVNNLSGQVNWTLGSSLRELDVSKNMLGGRISLVSGPGLIFLDMSSNRFSGKFPGNLSSLKSLRHLNLAGNMFSLSDFPNISLLHRLEYLNLSACHLRGSIPAEVFKLQNLQVLDVSQNLLTGHISLPVNGTNALAYLDLSVNNLTGDVPLELAPYLESMRHFNFSYNNLKICMSSSLAARFPGAFRSELYPCPIAVYPPTVEEGRHNRSHLALALGIGLGCLVVGLLAMSFACRKKAKWVVKQMSYKEGKHMSGPFSFETESFTWVADVKFASSVPVVMFEKPLLNITFADLLNATSHFNKETLLAEGRYGPVYRAILAGGLHVTVKVLVQDTALNDQEAATEFEFLGKIKHPNLVPLLGYCLAGDQRIAIYEFMENGNLHHWLHDLPLGTHATEDWSTDTWEQTEEGFQEELMMGWRIRHRIALGTARALAFLHHGCYPQIVHRDVKASSIYLDAALEPHLADFGLANITSGQDNAPPPGTPGYVPPEYGQTWTATSKGDVYSFGVVLFELITGKRSVGDSYPDSNEASLVGWVRYLIKENRAVSAIDPKLLSRGPAAQMQEALGIGYLCTADSPAKRPTMQQIVGLLKDMEPNMD